jgi:hypothetical protein
MDYVAQGGDDMIFRGTRLAVMMSAVINFCKQVDSVMDSNQAFNKVIGHNKSLMPLKGLANVTDLKSYESWKSHVGRFIKSNRVNSIAPSNILEDFFI